MKFIRLALWSFFLLVLPLAGQAQFLYSTNDGTITITYCACSGSTVNVPDTIGGLPVTAIGPTAFSDCPDPVGVTIPHSVTNIGAWAFYYAFGLTNITVDPTNPAYASVAGVLFDKSLTTLITYPRARLGSYTIPSTVTRIATVAFSGAAGLASVTIPGSVLDVGLDAFSDCTGLGSISIPSSVTNLGANAFAYCTSLTNVSLADGLISMGASAFSHCISLSGINIPDSVTDLGSEVFRECASLSSVTIGSGLTNLALGLFYGCPSLTNLTIPDGIINIDENAFFDCTGLVSVSIPDSVTQIGWQAFYECLSLTSIMIGSGLTFLGPRAFLFCNVLTNIEVSVLNPFFASQDGVLFNKDFTTLVRCPEGKSGNYRIPAGVSNIEREAFFYCTSLTNVTIPASVISIQRSGFAYCINVRGFFFEGTPPGLGQFVFDTDDWSTVYYLPSAIEAWGTPYGDRPTLLWNPVIETAGSSFGVRSNRFGFNINGTPDIPIVIAASTNLNQAAWFPVQSLNLTNGLFYFCDSGWTNTSTRFYRIITP